MGRLTRVVAGIVVSGALVVPRASAVVRSYEFSGTVVRSAPLFGPLLPGQGFSGAFAFDDYFLVLRDWEATLFNSDSLSVLNAGLDETRFDMLQVRDNPNVALGLTYGTITSLRQVPEPGSAFGLGFMAAACLRRGRRSAHSLAQRRHTTTAGAAKSSPTSPTDRPAGIQAAAFVTPL